MVDEKVPLEGCPREGCNEPIVEAFRTDQPFRLRRGNMVADHWCVIPRVDPATQEKVWVYVVIHGEVEGFKTGNEIAEEEGATTDEGEEGTTESELEEETTEEEEQPDVDALDPSDLPEFERAIVAFIEKEGSASLASVQGKMFAWDKGLDEVTAAVEWLKEAGYIAEVKEEVYETV